MTRRPGARLLLSLLVAAVVVAAGVALWRPGTAADDRATDASAAGPAAPADPTTPASGSPRARRPTGAAVPGPPAAAAVAVPRGQRPARIAIPAIGVDAEMADLGIAADGSIEVPGIAAQAGWLDTTPAPGQQGPAVVAGHVDSATGPAVFYRLGALSPGDQIEVTSRSGATSTFTVDGVRTYAQDDFPTGEVYGPVPGPALRLITCGGDYVAADGGYQSNVVVYAS